MPQLDYCHTWGLGFTWHWYLTVVTPSICAVLTQLFQLNSLVLIFPHLAAGFLRHSVDIARMDVLGSPRGELVPAVTSLYSVLKNTHVTQDVNRGLPPNVYGGPVSLDKLTFEDHISRRVAIYISLLRVLESFSIKESV